MRSPMIPGILARAMIAGPASTTTNSTRKSKAAPSGRSNARIMLIPLSRRGLLSCLRPDQWDVVIGARQVGTQPARRESVDRSVSQKRVDGRIDGLVVVRSLGQAGGEAFGPRQLGRHVVALRHGVGQRESHGQ